MTVHEEIGMGTEGESEREVIFIEVAGRYTSKHCELADAARIKQKLHTTCTLH